MKELTQCVQSSQSSEAAQTCMQAVAACAKALGFRFGPYVATVLPLVMDRCRAASQQSDSSSGAEEKEAALHAITAVVQYCAEVCCCSSSPTQPPLLPWFHPICMHTSRHFTASILRPRSAVVICLPVKVFRVYHQLCHPPLLTQGVQHFSNSTETLQTLHFNSHRHSFAGDEAAHG